MCKKEKRLVGEKDYKVRKLIKYKEDREDDVWKKKLHVGEKKMDVWER